MNDQQPKPLPPVQNPHIQPSPNPYETPHGSGEYPPPQSEGGGGWMGIVGFIGIILLLNFLSFVFDWGWIFY